MDAKILLGKILQRFHDRGLVQVDGYSSFGYIRETATAIYISREQGKDTRIPFNKLILAIEAFQKDVVLYNSGPSGLRKFGITHVTGPVWAILHLPDAEEFK